MIYLFFLKAQLASSFLILRLEMFIFIKCKHSTYFTFFCTEDVANSMPNAKMRPVRLSVCLSRTLLGIGSVLSDLLHSHFGYLGQKELKIS